MHLTSYPGGETAICRKVWTSCIHGRAMFPFWFEFSNIFKCHRTPITIYFSVAQLVMWKISFLDLKEHIYSHIHFTGGPYSEYNSVQIADILHCVSSISECLCSEKSLTNTKGRHMFVDWLNMSVYSSLRTGACVVYRHKLQVHLQPAQTLEMLSSHTL